MRAYLPPNPNPLFNQSDMVITVETDTGVMGIGEGGSRDLCHRQPEDSCTGKFCTFPLMSHNAKSRAPITLGSLAACRIKNARFIVLPQPLDILWVAPHQSYWVEWFVTIANAITRRELFRALHPIPPLKNELAPPSKLVIGWTRSQDVLLSSYSRGNRQRDPRRDSGNWIPTDSLRKALTADVMAKRRGEAGSCLQVPD